MNWTDLIHHYRRASFQPQLFAECDHRAGYEEGSLAHLGHWTVSEVPPKDDLCSRPSDPWVHLAAEVHQKILNRGRLTFPQLEVEEAILEFLPESLRGRLENPDSNLERMPSQELIDQWQKAGKDQGSLEFSPQSPGYNPFDPENPQNESRLCETLREVAGDQILPFLHAQAWLDRILPDESAEAFGSQRVDFIVALPSGRGLVIEPGDHDDDQKLRDRQRDEAFLRDFAFRTLRPGNDEIEGPQFKRDLERELNRIGWVRPAEMPDPRIRAASLAGPSIARIESCLVEYLLKSELWTREVVSLGIAERDGLPLAGLAVWSFLLQQEKLHRLYGKPFRPPKIELTVIQEEQENLPPPADEDSWLQPTGGKVQRVSGQIYSLDLDLLIDLSVTCGNLLEPITSTRADWTLIVRNSPPHHQLLRLNRASRPESCVITDETLPHLRCFLRDLFRKTDFRKDQIPILQSIVGSLSRLQSEIR